MGMCKQIFGLVLCILLLIGIALPVLAQENTTQLKISTVDELLTFAQNCRIDTYSQNLIVSLENNIDLGDVPFKPIPIFSGTFDGKGHTISGLTITAGGSVQGLFRYLTATAVVQNLAVRGSVQSSGSGKEIGGIAGRNEGYIMACSFTGALSGGEHVGGIAGTNAVTGIIEYSRANGEISGHHFVGGIAGENAGVIRGCANNGKINTKPQENDVELSDITMGSLTNTEASNTATDIGGIAGISSGVIRDCKNLGDVGYRYMSYNIGGIAGTQSGYITGCENLGYVQGRKEIGGIVGQMEPSAAITFSEDTLQILQRQLDDLSLLVDQASGNTQANAGKVAGQIEVLREQINTAQDTVDSLLPDASNPAQPDRDTVIAGFNTLSSTLYAMPTTFRCIVAASKTTANGLYDDLKVIAGKLTAMEEIMGSASSTIGGSFTDISDQDTAETLTGKVENCVNYGTVIADLNVGGIAGAMAVENDLDILEDWDKFGEESLYFKSEVRAVILNCSNYGVISAKKQNAGGVAGWQSMGLVKSSTNTGMLISPTGNYVGGISGLSIGYIRSSYARCEINASANAGGIAGKGSIVTDCLAMVKLSGCEEGVGTILGIVGEREDENAISSNYYLKVNGDPGAIDGISYSGKAEPMELDSFMSMENLPMVFQYVMVIFVADDGEIIQRPVPTGGTLDRAQIPVVPKKAGYTGTWDGLKDASLENILFDMTFMPVYTTRNCVIETEQTRENGLPLLLLEGTFTDEMLVSLVQSNVAPSLEDKECLLESWIIINNTGSKKARFLLPSNVDGDDVKLLVYDADGQWREEPFTQNGSYIVFSLQAADLHLALVEAEANVMPLVLAGAGAVAAAVLSLVLVFARQRKRIEQNVAQEQSVH